MGGGGAGTPGRMGSKMPPKPLPELEDPVAEFAPEDEPVPELPPELGVDEPVPVPAVDPEPISTTFTASFWQVPF